LTVGTNTTSALIAGLGQYPTNAIPTNSLAWSNYVSVGIPNGGSPQIIYAPKVFYSLAGTNAGLTNGVWYNGTNSNPVTTNLVNGGNAIRSEGTGSSSLQLGSNAVASGLRSVAVGVNSLATNTDSVAIGTGAIATNASSVAVGNTAQTLGDFSTAVG